MTDKLNIVVAGGGITGVSTAEWLRRDGHDVTLIDRIAPGDSGQTSYGNAGILARCAVVPVPVPGVWKKAPKMLLDPDGPLFLRWSYLPRLLPWLIPFLRNGRRDKVEAIAENAGSIPAITASSIPTARRSRAMPSASRCARRTASSGRNATAIRCWRSTPKSARPIRSPPPSMVMAGSAIQAAMWPIWQPGSRARVAGCGRRKFRKFCRWRMGAPP
jgi:hypothetical protein